MLSSKPVVVDVPSDSKAKYTLIEASVFSPSLVRSISRRDGPDGDVCFVSREIDHTKGLARRLSEGDTLEDLSRPNPVSVMGPLQQGSISEVMSRAACRAVGVELIGVQEF